MAQPAYAGSAAGRAGDDLDAFDHRQQGAVLGPDVGFDDPQRRPTGSKRLGPLERRDERKRPGLLCTPAHVNT